MARRARRGWVAMMTTVAGLSPASAFGAAPTEPETQESRELVRRGTECFLREDYECARTLLAQAYEAQPQAATLLKLGLSELHADHPVEAAAHLRDYVARDEEPADKREAVRTKWLPRAEAQTARLDVVAPAGAEVLLDGVAEGRGPMASLVVVEGEHEVIARQGSVEEAQHIMARGGEVVALHFQRVADAGPLGGARAGFESTPRAGEPDEAHPQTAKWITVLGLGSGAAAAAGLGIGFGLLSRAVGTKAQGIRHQLDPNVAGTECRSPAAACAALDTDVRAQKVDTVVSEVAYLAAGGLAVAAIASWILWPEARAPNPSTAIRPEFSARRAGMTLNVEW